MSGSSSWNNSPFSFSPNTNTMDANAMPSAEAAEARKRAKEIMLALEDGKPGDADRLMGDRPAKGTAGLLPVDYFRSKFKRSSKDKREPNEAKDGSDKVVR